MLPVHIVCISRRTILSSDEESDETAEPSYQPPTLPRSGPYRAPPLVSSSPPAPPPPPTANSPPPPPVGLRDPQLQIAPIGSSVHFTSSFNIHKYPPTTSTTHCSTKGQHDGTPPNPSGGHQRHSEYNSECSSHLCNRGMEQLPRDPNY